MLDLELRYDPSVRFAAPALLVSLVVSGCVERQPSSAGEPHASDPVTESGNGGASGPDWIPDEVASPPPRLLITEPDVLMALERNGLGLGALLHGTGSDEATSSYGQLPNADELTKPGPLPAITASLADRLAHDRAEDPVHTGVGLRYVHRQFDLRWLAAPDTRFELIGVVNRIDRHVFAPGSGLGETRLIYRLAYTRTQQGVTVDSRLPMTINVVFWQRIAGAEPPTSDAARGQALREVAVRWQAPLDAHGEQLAEWLRAPGHALAPEQLDLGLIKSVEIDVQTERWPSTIRPDMAGHAEYLLQVFRPVRRDEGSLGWVAAPLENTPDVARLRRDAKARARLLAWLREPAQQAAIDQGTLVVPDEFLALEATSVTPRGLARQANRPWSQLFSASDLSDLDLDAGSSVRSAAGLLRRLDGLSCQGCHETRSIAGFHLLGDERDPDKRVDALARFTSPHLDGELERRAAWVDTLLSGGTPSEQRELADHERARGAWGAHCGLGDPGFADWTCDAGLACTALGDPELGTCLEPEPGGAGAVCEVGRIKPRADHHEDRVVDLEASACAEGGVCNDNRVGFPHGMCAFSCASVRPEGACGVIPNLRSFNDCLAQKRPFASCIVETSNPALLRACDADAPCRDDFICARSDSDRGVCLPPYFLFQLRVDGHPS